MAFRSANPLRTALVLVIVSACRDTAVSHVASPQTEPDPGTARLVALYGDQVNGDPGADEAEPLVVALRDAAGRPVPGVQVTWSASEGGVVEPESAQTDAAGIARASWIFADSAAQSASASSVSSQVGFHGALRRAPAIPMDSLVVLNLATFDGSGQVVHPDVVFLPHSWDNGQARLAMAITPYPYGDAGRENPSLFVSEAGDTWAVPATATNPIVQPTAGYLSDPALVFDDSTHELRMYYRQVVDGYNVVRVVTTMDGVQWSAPRETIRAPSHHIVSPTVVRRSATNWLMWSVDGGTVGCDNQDAHVDLRRSADGVEWGAAARVALDQAGGYPWHIDVKWIGPLHEYWALYNLKTPGNCVTPAVYLATSTDGVQWRTYRQPVLQRGATAAFADIVYRSTFVYTKSDDMVTFYFSGARWDGTRYVWSGAVQRRARPSLFADIDWSGTRLLQPTRRGLPSPERFVGGPQRRKP